MAAIQDVFRIRRQYNQWVANQTLEDYALRFTAKSARRWSIAKVAMTALGTTAFLALEALGGTVTLQYGFVNSVAAITVVCALIFALGVPICVHAARHGVDIDLLTRGAGFGYLGSTITSLVYATFTFIFFAIEAAIMAVALELMLGIPLSVAYVICAIAVIPIVTHGITLISRFQIGSQYVWLALQLAALAFVAFHDYEQVEAWTVFGGVSGRNVAFDVVVFGAASGVLMALVAQLGEQVDYLRFLPQKTEANSRAWYTAVILAGPGWVLVGFVKLLLGSFVAFLIAGSGASRETASDPTHMYSQVYGYFHDVPQAALVLAGVMVLISQMKINVTNAYAGSIAWSNFFSRMTHSHPGRVVWLVFNVVIALLLMELGIYRVLENVLGAFAIVAVAWLGTLAVDLTVNRALGFSPKHVEFKRAHLYDVNPVGVGSMLLASSVGILVHMGALGAVPQALAHFVTLGVAAVAAPAIAWWTKGRYYLARSSTLPRKKSLSCCICEHDYETEDMAHCTAYDGAICSLCCSLDARCMDSCKPGARASDQLRSVSGRLLPEAAVAALFSSVGRFLGLFALSCVLLGGLLSLVYFVMSATAENPEPVRDALFTLFFVLAIVAGVLCWLFLLSSDSRLVAHQESARQTLRLLHEIEAHKKTDQALQEAKEVAEAANNAKTRYVSGISHEFRTPLQAILGYAQLMRNDPALARDKRRAVNVIHRSGEHLADLVEGLLDVSRIESGRIDLREEVVNFPGLVGQLEEIFRPLAEQKGIAFDVHLHGHIPNFVKSDEKRLRQILTNLLSNAVKFTHRGGVAVHVSYRSQVAEVRVVDTGVGIAADDIDMIFRPFERVRNLDDPVAAGTGLGLTIVKLLCEVMGGDITVESRPGEGSTFTASLYLPTARLAPKAEPELPHVRGYEGVRRRVMVVDDDPVQRGLIDDMLTPLGFDVLEARDAEHCLKRIGGGDVAVVDLFLLDVAMPGMDGLTLAGELRARGMKQPIVMISANAQEPPPQTELGASYDAYLVKPIRVGALIERIGQCLTLDWIADSAKTSRAALVIPTLEAEVRAVLLTSAEVGHERGLRKALDGYVHAGRVPEPFAEALHDLADTAQFQEIAALIKRVPTA